MGESQQVRLQQDIVNEIKEYDGSSFSEKFRNWKQAEIVQRIDKIGGSDNLSQEDIRKACEEAIRNVQR